MRTRQEILDEIKRTAKDNGGQPLGAARFESETGIKPYDWEKFWAQFGDAQREAGFTANQMQSAYRHEFLFEKIIGLMRKLGKVPTYREITVERNNDPELPNKKVFGRWGTKEQLVKKVLEYCENKDGYDDIVGLCAPILKNLGEQENPENVNSNETIGEVYLFKSGRYYKVGKTNDTVRRGTELRIQLPERIHLIHSFKTDDPSGVEAYWHKRFESKRMSGEWFDLNSVDIRAFKRWRRIY